MSLDISLISDNKKIRYGTGIYVRENGNLIELTVEEVFKRFPDTADVTVYKFVDDVVFESNITHNLGQMAKNAFLYYPLWRPDEKGWKKAKDITRYLEKGLIKLKSNPDKFRKFNPDNNWGRYEDLVAFVENYLEACKKYPESKIEVDR